MTMEAKHEDLLIECSGHIEWDPSTEDVVQWDQTKIRHIFKRHFQGTKEGDQLADAAGDTLYKALRNQPCINLLLYAKGDVSAGQLLDVTKKGLVENLNRYRSVIDDGEQFVKLGKEVLQHVWDIRQSGIAGFDMSKVEIKVPSSSEATALNALLSTTTLPPIQTMVNMIKDADNNYKELATDLKDSMNEAEGLRTDIERLQEELSKASIASSFEAIEVAADEDLGIPEGKANMKKASEMFPGVEFETDFDVPVFDWEHKHPLVPAVDEHYIFRVKELQRVLYALLTNKRAYLQGHTGSGKTTLIEQVCAHLNYPFVRVNFDSEVTRMDLIGRDTLSVDKDGSTISEFVEGILPRAMASPCILCCDEIDFVRPDVAYVMQAALEGNGLRITEDGDRLVTPHPMFRMIATGNTVGQGDEHGMYQGARPQSLALLDRFTIWIKIGYLSSANRDELVKRHFPGLSLDNQKALSKYMEEHLEAFTTGKVLQPISPRGMLAIAQATMVFNSLSEALSMTVLDRASEDDRAVLAGIIDRVS